MLSFFKKIEVPHVFTLLTIVIFFSSLLTYVLPSGSYSKQEITVNGLKRNVVKPNSYTPIEKHITLNGMFMGEKVADKATPTSFIGFLSAIPRGMEASADIIFFIFILGGVFGILQKSGVIVAFLYKLLEKYGKSGPLLTIVIMTILAIGGSTLGMGEEFIPLVPIFLLVSKEMGYDRIYGLALVILAADIGFAAATTNPFTVNIAQGIAELPINSEWDFRLIFMAFALTLTIGYVLWYGAKIKKDPTKSIMYGDDFDMGDLKVTKIALNGKRKAILLSVVVIFGFILYAVQSYHWWLAEMGGGFLLIGIVAVILSDLKVSEAVKAFVKGMEEMVVAALVVGFARAIQVVLDDGQILDSIIYYAALLLQEFPNVVAAQGMLAFQTILNFFIPSGSGQAAVTMPLMAPLSDVLGLSRQTAVFAFTCGDGFSNTIIPTSGVLMAMLSLAKIPYQKWLKFMAPLFIMLIVLSGIFLTISVYYHG